MTVRNSAGGIGVVLLQEFEGISTDAIGKVYTINAETDMKVVVLNSILEIENAD